MLQVLDGARQSIRRRAVGASLAKEVPSEGSDSGTALSAAAHLQGCQEALGARLSSKESPQNRVFSNILNAKDNPKEFSRHYLHVIKRFVIDKTKYELELPHLDGFDRLVVHAIAEKCNLSHHSEGGERHRLLRLKKDELFFQKPNAVDDVDLEDILRNLSEKESKFHLRRVVVALDPLGEVAQKGLSSSKAKTQQNRGGHSRGVAIRTVQVGQVGSYGDEEALEKIERFRRATNDYLYATDMGCSTEELLLQQEMGNKSNKSYDPVGEGREDVGLSIEERLAMGSVEEETKFGPDFSSGKKRRLMDIALRVDAGEVEKGDSSSNSIRSNNGSSKVGDSSTSVHSSSNFSSSSSFPVEKSYMEVCTGCWSRVPVIIPLQQWRCEKFCGACSRTVIWRLEEIPTPSQKMNPSNTNGGGTTYAGGTQQSIYLKEKGSQNTAMLGVREPFHKRQRSETLQDDEWQSSSSPPLNACLKESSNTDEDEEDSGAVLLLSDVTDFLSLNDFSVSDMHWIQNFTTTAVRVEKGQIIRTFGLDTQKSLHLSTRNIGQDNDSLCLRNYLTFCIDFNDILHLQFFKHYEYLKAFSIKLCEREFENDGQKRRLEDKEGSENRGEADCMYVVVRAHQGINMSLTSLMEEVLKAAFMKGDSAKNEAHVNFPFEELYVHIAMAIPNISVYGVEATAICQLRTIPQYLLVMQKKYRGVVAKTKHIQLASTSSFKPIHNEGLQRLQQEYGEDHVFFTKSLELAVEKAASG